VNAAITSPQQRTVQVPSVSLMTLQFSKFRPLGLMLPLEALRTMSRDNPFAEKLP
jgi:hypothetical protein